MDFGWPNSKIGRKIANGQLLLLALYVCMYVHVDVIRLSQFAPTTT